MFLISLIVVTVLFGPSNAEMDVDVDDLSVDAVADLSVDIHEASASIIFQAQFRKFRHRAGPNVDQIIGLISNGSTVATQVMTTFDKVYNKKDGGANLTEILQVAKAAYLVGKEIFKVGKYAYNSTKTFFQENPELFQVGKTMATTFKKVAQNLGQTLAGVGLAFAFITSFAPKEGTTELKAIQAGFREMHQRFDKVSRQIEILENKIDFYQAIKSYTDVRNNLENMYRKYQDLTEVPTSAGYKQTFREACVDQNIEPLQALAKLRRIIVNPGPEDQPHMVNALIIYYKLNYTSIMAWFEKITYNAVTLATLRSACFGILNGQDDSALQHSLNQTEVWVKEIIAELAKYEEKFTNIDEDYVHVLRGELKEIGIAYDAAAEQELNQRCEKVEKELTGSAEVCLGDKKINAKRVAVNTFLNKKYHWLNWLVVVYTRDEGNEDNPCGNAKEGQHWVHTPGSHKEQRVFVSWSRRDAVRGAALRKEALDVMDKTLQEFNPKEADKKGIYYGVKGKYYDIFNAYMTQQISKWLQSQNYSNKLFCMFNGYPGDYYRSIVTSGVAAHRPQVGKKYIIDYVVSFY